MSKFRYDVVADSGGNWATNHLEFNSFEEAKEAGINLANRWMLVTKVQVVEYEVLSLDEDGKTDGIEIIKETVVWGD